MAHEHADLHDPETDPLATYVLEPDDVRSLLARVVAGPAAATSTSHTPFTGAPIAAVPLTTPDDLPAAARRARAAQRTWAARPLRERTAVLGRVHDLLLERQSDVLDLLQIETGKARGHAWEEVGDVANVARHYAVRARRYLAPRREAGVLPLVSSARVLRHPVGVVAVVAPWNYPLTLGLGDVLPAVAAGNAVLLRADPRTALTLLWCHELLEDAGLPADVVQVVVGGPDVGMGLLEHVDHASFTGSTAAGRVFAARAGELGVPVVLELGGKNPMYVAEDVDVDVAAEGAVRACFGSAGQLCLSIERIYVHEAVRRDFTDAFVRRVRQLRVAPGLDYRSDMGSLASAAQLATVVEHVEDAVGLGATVLTGAEQRTDLGPWFYAPTVLTDVPEHARLAREETFGPVVALYPVASDDEAVAAMNDTEHGLFASIWTADTRRGARLAARVQAGAVVVNEGYAGAYGAVAAPLGGTKASGFGARHGREGLWATTSLQTVVVHRGAHGGRLPRTGHVYGLGHHVWPQVLTRWLELRRALRTP
ncbi:succinic semialdehyde dehydrogenase [Cellulomonas oligotrophica]|uniref:Succinate-semialdehyde dehydrogenase/glutarate-semialdehyde dehydrogenase n=1 Tax=Cellulomonas oligotrophica TaxID=931536 RepID=A0A7Y9FED6_9CELL|nr:succinic semialdehyde dehydrogenase [Cellulomonas oligotrophica]NYD85437.1 succinate-semialdehyde dehydrogenase/glutarate-semialdehyde dehydrogenase [Cellulomonas oligotrophica]GIG31554.1 succinic semialdehyde dehydrogenase [Cellulomonas oligotrophica]